MQVVLEEKQVSKNELETNLNKSVSLLEKQLNLRQVLWVS